MKSIKPSNKNENDGVTYELRTPVPTLRESTAKVVTPAKAVQSNPKLVRTLKETGRKTTMKVTTATPTVTDATGTVSIAFDTTTDPPTPYFDLNGMRFKPATYKRLMEMCFDGESIIVVDLWKMKWLGEKI